MDDELVRLDGVAAVFTALGAGTVTVFVTTGRVEDGVLADVEGVVLAGDELVELVVGADDVEVSLVEVAPPPQALKDTVRVPTARAVAVRI